MASKWIYAEILVTLGIDQLYLVPYYFQILEIVECDVFWPCYFVFQMSNPLTT